MRWISEAVSSALRFVVLNATVKEGNILSEKHPVDDRRSRLKPASHRCHKGYDMTAKNRRRLLNEHARLLLLRGGERRKPSDEVASDGVADM